MVQVVNQQCWMILRQHVGLNGTNLMEFLEISPPSTANY